MAPKKVDCSYQNWMENLPSHLTTLPLNCLAIPGSHDSPTSCITSASKISPDAAPAWRHLAHIFGRIGRCIVAQWSRTQNLTLADQLRLGIRYLDLRVALNPDDSQFYLVHGLYACHLIQALTDISSFLRNHPKEVLLLDFNHFFGMTENDHERLTYLILDNLGSNICAPFQGCPPSLSQLWSRGHQAIIFYHHTFPFVTYKQPQLHSSSSSSPFIIDTFSSSHSMPSVLFWPGHSIPSPWPNTTQPETMVTFLDRNYSHHHAQCSNSFFIFQGVLTPDANTVICHLCGSLETSLAPAASQAYLSWLSNKTAGPGGVNICLVDFVDHLDYVGAVIALNKRLLITFEETADLAA